MSNTVVDRLREERDEARAAAVALAESEKFNPEDETYVALKTRAESLDSRIGELATLLEARKSSDALDGRLSKVESRRQERSGWSVTSEPAPSLGDTFIRSDAFSEYSGSPRGRMPKVELNMQTRALPTGLSDIYGAGLLTTPTTTRDIQPPPFPTPLLDAVNRIQVSTNSVDLVLWEKVAGGAAVVAEKADKPSVEFAPVVTSDSLDNIAAYTQLTRQMIEDAPAVRDKVNGQLVREILRAEEAAVAAALGAAVLPTYAGSVAAGDDLLSSIRAGVGEVQSAGYAPNAILLNPADWAALDNVVMSSTLNGPAIRQNFWGLTPIPVVGQAAGTAIVGDVYTAVENYYRSEIALYITDSHASTFLANVFTLLAERRSLAAVVQPNALVEVSVGA
ncbi:MAG: phage major capsid protein [Dermatophilaceae bacterium]|nr:phage major capsid protein [Intrasporangiaceae bacterium]